MYCIITVYFSWQKKTTITITIIIIIIIPINTTSKNQSNFQINLQTVSILSTRIYNLKAANKAAESHFYLPELDSDLLTSLKKNSLNIFIVFFTDLVGQLKYFPKLCRLFLSLTEL